LLSFFQRPFVFGKIEKTLFIQRLGENALEGAIRNSFSFFPSFPEIAVVPIVSPAYIPALNRWFLSVNCSNIGELGKELGESF